MMGQILFEVSRTDWASDHGDPTNSFGLGCYRSQPAAPGHQMLRAAKSNENGLSRALVTLASLATLDRPGQTWCFFGMFRSKGPIPSVTDTLETGLNWLA